LSDLINQFQALSSFNTTGNNTTTSATNATPAANQAGTSSDTNNTTPTTQPAANPPTLNRIPLNLEEIGLFFARVLPLVVLPVFILMYWHWLGVLVFLWLVSVTLSSESRLREQVALKQGRQVTRVLFTMFILALTIGVLFLFFYSKKIWHYFYYTVPELKTTDNVDLFFEALFYVFITDSIVKFSGMLIKCAIVLIMPNLVKKYVHVGRLLALVEVCVQLYRTTLPANVWIRHLLGSFNQGFAIAVIVFYGIFKFGTVVSILFDLVVSVRNLFSSTCPYGQHLSSSEIVELGEHSECSICLQTYTRPIRLNCNHIYCEQCISDWVQTGNHTCPVCRAPVGGVPSSSRFEKGGTAFFCLV